MPPTRRSTRIAEKAPATSEEATPSDAGGNSRKRTSSPSGAQATSSKRSMSVFSREKKADKISPQTIVGLPSDPFPRTILNVDDLDLDRSYVGQFAQAKPELPAMQKRWSHPGPEPLLDQTQVPKGWNSQEPNLDKDDIDGQIQRCHERIQDNILPYIFEQRLVEWESKRAARSAEMAREKPGLSWKVVKRLKNLALVREHLEQAGDEYEQLANVAAVEKAYRSGALVLQPGLVVYFSRGEQLCQPRPFDWDEFEAINKKHRGDKSFWTEGMSDVHEPQFLGATLTLEDDQISSLLTYFIAVRIPGERYYAELEFMHDTGASCAAIRLIDLGHICGPFQPTIPMIGTQPFNLADGRVVSLPIIELEMAVLKEGKRISPFLRVPAIMKQDLTGARLDGPFARHAVYTASKPDGRGTTFFSSGVPAWRLGMDIPHSRRPRELPLMPAMKPIPKGKSFPVPMPPLGPARAALGPKDPPAGHWGVP